MKSLHGGAAACFPMASAASRSSSGEAWIALLARPFHNPFPEPRRGGDVDLFYLAAGLLAAVTGVVHSVLGERLIFRHLRHGGMVPTRAAPPLRERHVRILWATWHLGSVFGWGFGAVLLCLALEPASMRTVLVAAIVCANLGGSVLVLVATRGRHPGWIALLLVAVLVALAARTG
jgi:hypothetical protein